jgi:tetratricopeptide (TPR) repeat protein
MARKRFLFFHRRHSFCLLKPNLKIRQRKPRVNLLFCLLFLGAFLLSQAFAWFWGATQLPVLAHSSAVGMWSSVVGWKEDSSLSSLSPLSPLSSPSPTGFDHTPAVVSVAQESANPQTLVEQGKQLYDAGKFSEAVAVLRKAADAFKAQGNRLQEAMALSNLALAYQQLGAWSEAEQALKDSLNLLQSKETVNNLPSGKTTERLQILAQTLDIYGRLQLSRGQPEQALQTWQQATATHAQIGNREGRLQSQINQAQALQSLGFYTRACKTLLNGLGIDNDDCQISDAQLQTLKNQPDSLTQAVALRSLGDALQLVGDLQQAENVLKVSLDIAQRLRSPQNISATLFSLGNTVRAQRTIESDSHSRTATTASALDFYQQAAEAATSPMLKLQALLNQLSLLIETICTSPSTLSPNSVSTR